MEAMRGRVDVGVRVPSQSRKRRSRGRLDGDVFAIIIDGVEIVCMYVERAVRFDPVHQIK